MKSFIILNKLSIKYYHLTPIVSNFVKVFLTGILLYDKIKQLVYYRYTDKLYIV